MLLDVDLDGIGRLAIHSYNQINFAAPDLVDPFSHQASLGFQRQIGSQASVEADWVYTGDRDQFQTRNINVAYNAATGGPYPDRGQAVAGSSGPCCS